MAQLGINTIKYIIDNFNVHDSSNLEDIVYLRMYFAECERDILECKDNERAIVLDEVREDLQWYIGYLTK